MKFVFQGDIFSFKFGKQTAHTSYFESSICFIARTSITNMIGIVKEFCLNCTQAKFITVSDMLEVR